MNMGATATTVLRIAVGCVDEFWKLGWNLAELAEVTTK